MSLSTLLVALALVSAGVFIALAFTRWGRRRPLHRYGALSVAAHLLLFGGLACIRTGGAPQSGADDAPPVTVQIVMRSPSAYEDAPKEADSIEEVVAPSLDEPAEAEPVAQSVEAPSLAESKPTAPSKDATANIEPKQAAAAPADPTPSTQPTASLPEAARVDVGGESIADSLRDLLPTTPTDVSTPATSVDIPEWFDAQAIEPGPSPSVSVDRPPPRPVPRSEPAKAATPAAPAAYATRGELQQRRLSANQGGDAATVDAVAAAVDWFVRTQRPDGAWDAAKWGAGRETRVLGDDRGGAGGRAETGLTGLALLAMGGAGHTHLAGPHRDTVTRGLQFLLDSQKADGDLAGDAKPFARTYCHSMATFALAEGMAVTGDERLRPAVEAAVDYLTRSQNAAGGGWRYHPGERGDTSQMGWAVMALRSAELAGIAVRPSVWRGCERFVSSVATGRSGGLAAYKPQQRPSNTMTAEAMYVRQILGVSNPRSAADAEAVAAMLADPPASSASGRRQVANLYYWYYATLALHHHSPAGDSASQAWQTWNRSLQRAVLPGQVASGPNSGSWDPDTLWGPYGGRVYSTALATMCLEVYYRYDPETIGRDPWLAAREGAMRR